MSRKVISVAGFVAIALTVNSAAWAWGQVEMRTKPIWTETIRLKLRDGQRGTSTVNYEITTGFQINEGNGGFGRNCQFNGQPRTFRRTVVVKPDGGEALTLGEKIIALPNAGGYNFNQPCSDVVGQLEQKLGEQLGSYATWRSQIDDDLQQVRKTLALIGELDK